MLSRSPFMPNLIDTSGSGSSVSPVKIRAAGLLEHFFQRNDGHSGNGNADQAADQRRVRAHVPGHGEHGFQGSECVVEPALGNLGLGAVLELHGQTAHRRQIGKQRIYPVSLELQENLPVGVVEPAPPCQPE